MPNFKASVQVDYFLFSYLQFFEVNEDFRWRSVQQSWHLRSLLLQMTLFDHLIEHWVLVFGLYNLHLRDHLFHELNVPP